MALSEADHIQSVQLPAYKTHHLFVLQFYTGWKGLPWTADNVAEIILQEVIFSKDSRNKLLSYWLINPHCNENLIYIFLEKELRALSPNVYIHVSVSDLYVYSEDRSTIFGQHNRQTDPGDIYIAHRHMNVEIGDWGCAIPFLGIFASNFRYWVVAVLKLERIRGTCLAKQRRLKYTSLFMYSRGCKRIHF